MKFLCIECDRQMSFEERQLPGDGTLAVAFRCPACNRSVAMLTNPMETQLVSSLGVKIGGSAVTPQPLQSVRSMVATGSEAAFAPDVPDVPDARGAGVAGAAPAWSVDARARLLRVPTFVRGMVKKIYGDYARERGIEEITPDVMDQARTELGLEGM